MQVLLIDLENCPSQLNELLDNLANYSQVVICYAQSGTKVPIDWILPLTKVLGNDNLKIIKMPSVGKNAADFGIAFLAGVLMEKSSKKTHFDIVSNDTDLDFVIDLLKLHNRSATRIGKAVKEKIEKMPVIQESKRVEIPALTTITPLQIYCSHLAKYPNKPAKKTTLLNSIKSKFQEKVIPEELLAELLKQNVITINNEKVGYNQQKINTFKIQE
jgi:hypothetical protein